MKNHPGQRMAIYDLPGLEKEAISVAATPANIAQGFACTGIWPYNKDIIPDIEFAPASVTDQPNEDAIPEQLDSQELPNKTSPFEQLDSQELLNNTSPSAPSTSGQILPQMSTQATSRLTIHASPCQTSFVDSAPLPKAPP